jgi:hypothetical protein
MEPLLFGSAERQLFGWLHLPGDRQPRRTGVVLCAPFGQEYVLAHRALFGLAGRLAEAGFAALRFDWFGTGDSAGELTEASVEAWKQDLKVAVATLRARVRCDDVALVGMRLGGSLALLAGAPPEPAALVLWDPVIEGTAFLRELEVAHWRETHGAAPPPDPMPGPLTEASGFPVCDGLRDGLRAIDLKAAGLDPGVPLLLLETARGDARSEAGRAELVRAWQGRGHAVETLRFPGPAVWEEDEQRVLVPRAALDGAVRWLEAAC